MPYFLIYLVHSDIHESMCESPCRQVDQPNITVFFIVALSITSCSFVHLPPFANHFCFQGSRFFSAICSYILLLIIVVSSFRKRGKHVMRRKLDGVLPFAGSFGISTVLPSVSQEGTFVLFAMSFN